MHLGTEIVFTVPPEHEGHPVRRLVGTIQDIPFLDDGDGHFVVKLIGYGEAGLRRTGDHPILIAADPVFLQGIGIGIPVFIRLQDAPEVSDPSVQAADGQALRLLAVPEQVYRNAFRPVARMRLVALPNLGHPDVHAGAVIRIGHGKAVGGGSDFRLIAVHRILRQGVGDLQVVFVLFRKLPEGLRPAVLHADLRGSDLFSAFIRFRDQVHRHRFRTDALAVVVVFPDLLHSNIDLIRAVGDVAGPGFGFLIIDRIRIADSVAGHGDILCLPFHRLRHGFNHPVADFRPVFVKPRQAGKLPGPAVAGGHGLFDGAAIDHRRASPGQHPDIDGLRPGSLRVVLIIPGFRSLHGDGFFCLLAGFRGVGNQETDPAAVHRPDNLTPVSGNRRLSQRQVNLAQCLPVQGFGPVLTFAYRNLFDLFSPGKGKGNTVRPVFRIVILPDLPDEDREASCILIGDRKGVNRRHAALPVRLGSHCRPGVGCFKIILIILVMIQVRLVGQGITIQGFHIPAVSLRILIQCQRICFRVPAGLYLVLVDPPPVPVHQINLHAAWTQSLFRVHENLLQDHLRGLVHPGVNQVMPIDRAGIVILVLIAFREFLGNDIDLIAVQGYTAVDLIALQGPDPAVLPLKVALVHRNAADFRLPVLHHDGQGFRTVFLFVADPGLGAADRRHVVIVVKFRPGVDDVAGVFPFLVQTRNIEGESRHGDVLVPGEGIDGEGDGNIQPGQELQQVRHDGAGQLLGLEFHRQAGDPEPAVFLDRKLDTPGCQRVLQVLRRLCLADGNRNGHHVQHVQLRQGVQAGHFKQVDHVSVHRTDHGNPHAHEFLKGSRVLPVVIVQPVIQADIDMVRCFRVSAHNPAFVDREIQHRRVFDGGGVAVFLILHHVFGFVFIHMVARQGGVLRHLILHRGLGEDGGRAQALQVAHAGADLPQLVPVCRLLLDGFPYARVVQVPPGRHYPLALRGQRPAVRMIQAVRVLHHVEVRDDVLQHLFRQLNARVRSAARGAAGSRLQLPDAVLDLHHLALGIHLIPGHLVKGIAPVVGRAQGRLLHAFPGEIARVVILGL